MTYYYVGLRVDLKLRSNTNKRKNGTFFVTVKKLRDDTVVHPGMDTLRTCPSRLQNTLILSSFGGHGLL